MALIDIVLELKHDPKADTWTWRALIGNTLMGAGVEKSKFKAKQEGQKVLGDKLWKQVFIKEEVG